MNEGSPVTIGLGLKSVLNSLFCKFILSINLERIIVFLLSECYGNSQPAYFCFSVNKIC